MPFRTAARLVLRSLAFVSGLCTLSLLLLPLVLALLMLLFDSTAQGVMVLLGSVANWFRSTLPGGGVLPPYRTLSLDPAAIALSALLCMAPCLAGLVITILLPARRLAWGLAVLLWLAAILAGGRLVGVVLSPGLLAALLLAGGLASIDAGERRPA